MSANIALILLNWNQWALTGECLRLLQGLSSQRWVIWVVDNGSSQKPPAGFETLHPTLRLLRLPENFGFTGGCNRGAEAALKEGAEALVFLNNDARVSPDDLERLVRTLRDGYDILGGVNYRPSAPNLIFSTGQRFLWPLCRIQRLGALSQTEIPQAVPSIIGSCFAVRREVFERIGFFDERFFIYYEESDFCLRAHSAGFRVACHPQVKVWHEGLTTFGDRSPAALYLYTRNLGLFAATHCPRPVLPFCFFSYALQVLLKSLYLLGKGGVLQARAVWIGFVDSLWCRFDKSRLDLFLKR